MAKFNIVNTGLTLETYNSSGEKEYIQLGGNLYQNERMRFRAWNKKHRKMEFINDFYWFKENGVHVENGNRNYSLYTITQCIGRKDINENWIYEDDIVKIDNGLGDTFARVYWNGIQIDDFGGEDSRKRFDEYEMEVVGNIYENLDLINPVVILKDVNKKTSIKEKQETARIEIIIVGDKIGEHATFLKSDMGKYIRFHFDGWEGIRAEDVENIVRAIMPDVEIFTLKTSTVPDYINAENVIDYWETERIIKMNN